MELKHVGFLGLVLGLAVYGCGDDSTSGGGGSTGGDAGAATGGASTGGASTGGAATGGSAQGGGGMGGMGAMGGMGGAPTLESACPTWCQVQDDLTGTDCDDGFTAMYGDLAGCISYCQDEEEYLEACAQEWLDLVACEANAAADDFQCSQFGVATAGSSPCIDLRDAHDDCWFDNAP